MVQTIRYIEESGFRGYHIWVLFTEWIPIRYIHLLEEIIESKISETDPELVVEYFPNKTRVNQNKPGQAMKLPLGFHIKTGRQGRFFTEDFEVVTDAGKYISQMARFSLVAVKRIIGTSSNSSSEM